jgi:hypothetical protein
MVECPYEMCAFHRESDICAELVKKVGSKYGDLEFDDNPAAPGGLIPVGVSTTPATSPPVGRSDYNQRANKS